MGNLPDEMLHLLVVATGEENCVEVIKYDAQLSAVLTLTATLVETINIEATYLNGSEAASLAVDLTATLEQVRQAVMAELGEQRPLRLLTVAGDLLEHSDDNTKF